MQRGILFAEIQQTSDITYRIYDWDRTDDKGNKRELHTNFALEAFDYKLYNKYKTLPEEKLNSTKRIIKCDYFQTNILNFDKEIIKDYYKIDSFIIYMCINGNFDIFYNNQESVNVKKGETILLPAVLKNIKLVPKCECKILEVFIQ